VAFVNDLAADRGRGRAQARLAGVGGLALALSPIVCGAIAQRWGIGWVFGTMALVGAAGALVLVTGVRETHPAPAALPWHGRRWRRNASPH
jgi:MFS family permease